MYTPEQILQKIWLTQKETWVYLKCLEYGWLTVTWLFRLLEYPRTTLYDTLQKLELKGYITKIKRNQTLTFYAINIQEIMALTEDKIKKHQREKELLNESIPSFQQLIKWTHQNPSIKIYQWRDALSIIFSQVKKTETVKTIYSAQAAADFLDEKLIAEVHGAHEYRKTPKKVLLVNEPAGKVEKIKLESQWFEVKLLPAWHHLYTDFIILDSKLFFLTYGKKIQVMEIENEILLNSHREIFDILRESRR